MVEEVVIENFEELDSIIVVPSILEDAKSK
jgi:hypothetical protein